MFRAYLIKNGYFEEIDSGDGFAGIKFLDDPTESKRAFMLKMFPKNSILIMKISATNKEEWMPWAVVPAEGLDELQKVFDKLMYCDAFSSSADHPVEEEIDTEDLDILSAEDLPATDEDFEETEEGTPVSSLIPVFSDQDALKEKLEKIQTLLYEIDDLSSAGIIR